MPKLNVRLGDQRHSAWMNYCDERGLVSADEIRDFIDSKLGSNVKPEHPHLLKKAGGRVELKMRLTELEGEGIRLRARLADVSRQNYVIRIIRADLARIPVMEETATSALRDHTDTMNAIGRNLNQIARALNRNEMPDRSMQLGHLVKDINEQAGIAKSLIDVCYSRCGISV